MRYKLVLFGGSIGEASHRKSIIYESKEEAKRNGIDYIRSFSGGHRNYYHPRYRVIEVK